MKIGWGECGTRSATGRRPGWASRLLGEPQWLVIRVSSQSLSLAAPHAGIAHSALLSLRTLPSLPSGPAHAHCLATLTCPQWSDHTQLLPSAGPWPGCTFSLECLPLAPSNGPCPSLRHFGLICYPPSWLCKQSLQSPLSGDSLGTSMLQG